MAYANFKPTVWSKYIQHELSKMTVLQEDCNTCFEGEIGLGKTVKIIGVSRPNVGTYVPGSDIDSAETPADSSMLLTVDQFRYTHFIVDDVDRAQAQEGLMQAYLRESTSALAECRDRYIAATAAAGTLRSASLAVTNAAEARAAVDTALVTLWDNGVKVTDGVSITVSPWFYALLKNALTAELSNNAELLQKGVLGLYNGATVKMSNNLARDGADDCMLVRTKNAVAFAAGIEKTEAYRPDKQFADAVKVLDCYGAKLVRPRELYVVRAHKG